MTEELARLKKKFRESFGGEPAYYVRAPGRVNLIGEHIDYNGGLVLPIAIDREIRLMARPRKDGRFRLRSLRMEDVYEGTLPESPVKEAGWTNYIFGIIHEFQKAGYRPPGFDGLYDSDLAVAAGLGSSGALDVACAWFIHKFLSTPHTRLELAQLCQRGDNNFVGVRCGLMDQAISACAEPGKALKLDCAVPRAEPVATGFSGKAEFLVAHSGVERKLTLSAYNERRNQCEEALRIINRNSAGENYPDLVSVPETVLGEVRYKLGDVLFRRARHVISEQGRVVRAIAALEKGDAGRFGELLDASHESLREDYEVSCPELEDLTGWLRSREGVFGSRLTGAGFGGCTVSLVAKEKAKGVLSSLLSEFYPGRDIEPLTLFSPARGGVSAISTPEASPGLPG